MSRAAALALLVVAAGAVAALAFAFHAAFATSPNSSATCSASLVTSTVTVTVSNTSASSIVTVSALAGDYVVGAGAVNSNCDSLALATYPNLVVQGTNTQYTELDFISNSADLLNSGTCLTFNVNFGSGAGAYLTVADGGAVGAGPDPTVVQSGCQSGGGTVTTAISTSGVSTLDVEGAAPGTSPPFSGSTLDLSAVASPTPGASESLQVQMGADTPGAPGTSGIGSVLTTVASSNFTIDFGGEAQVDGSTTIPTSFQLQQTTSTPVTLNGTPTLANELDLTSSTTSGIFKVAMNAASLGVSCPSGALYSGGTDDCFSGISSVQGSSSTQTFFFPDPKLTSTPSSGVSFTGNDQTPLGSVVDAFDIGNSSYDGGNSASNFVISVAGDSTSSPGSVTAKVTNGTTTSSVVFATFSGVNDIAGSASIATAFDPGTINGMAFFGEGSAANTLDLTSSTNSSGFVVAMNAAAEGSSACTGVAPNSGVVIAGSATDCFLGVSDVNGSSTSPTTFEPDPTLTATPSPGVNFAGEDSAPGSSVVDLTGFTSSVSGLAVAAGADDTTTPGTVAASSPPVTFASFAGVNEVFGSTHVPTTLRPGDATGLFFAGNETAGAEVDLSGESGSQASTFSVTSGGDSTPSPGTFSGTSANGVAISDSFSGVTTVLGAPKGTTFSPGSTSQPTFQGSCTGTNILDLSGVSANSIAVQLTNATTPCNGVANGSVTAATTSGNVTTAVEAIEVVRGSTSTATSVAPGTSQGITFVGQGSGLANAVDLSGESSPYTVSSGSNNATTPGQYAPVGGYAGGSGQFEGVATVLGSTGGTTFTPGGANGITFEGKAGSGKVDTLQLPTSSALLTVDVGGDSVSSPGQVSIGSATTFFSGITSFSGNPGAGGTTFDGTQVGTSDLTYSGAGTGANTLSFGSLVASPTLYITASGSSGQAWLGAPSGTTSTQIGSFSGITVFDGCVSGLGKECGGTDFQPSIGTTATFNGPSGSSGNTLDFSTLSSGGVTVSYNGGNGSGTMAAGGVVTFTNVQIFDGSPAADTFALNSGSGATFNGEGGSDTLSFVNDNGALPVSIQLSAASCTSSVTVQCESATISTLSGPSSATGITTFVGASGGQTTFTSDGYGGHTFTATGTSNTLDLSSVTNATPIVNAAGGCSGNSNCVEQLGAGLGSSTIDQFSGIQTFKGANGGTTFFSSGTAGLSFAGGSATGDTLDLAPAPTGTRVDMGSGCGGTVTTTAGTENYSDIGQIVGPSGGGATFVASPSAVAGSGTCGGASAVTFQGEGPGNVLDLSAVPTGNLVAGQTTAVVDVEPASGPGTVYSQVSSGPTPTPCPQAVTVSGTATTLTTFRGIAQFIGAKSGYTTYITGSAGGLTFQGASQSTNNAISFLEATSGVQVFLAPNSSNFEQASTGSGTDSFDGISTVVGSPGNDTISDGPGSYCILGGGGTDTFDATGAQGGITLSEQAGTATITGGDGGTMTTSGVFDFVGSSQGLNSFTADQGGGYSFTVPPSGQGSVNTLSFQNSALGVTVDITSSTGGGTVSGLAAGGPSGTATTDSFSGISSFVGSPENDSFTVGAGTYDLSGGGSVSGTSGDSLSFAGTSSAVTLNLTSSPPSASGTGVTDQASGFSQFTGNALGRTDFIAPAIGGYGFTGLGGSDQLDLSAAPAAITINAQSGVVSELEASGSGSTADTFGGIAVFDGSSASNPASATAFVPGCAGGEQFSGVADATLDLALSACRATGGSTITVNTTALTGTLSPLPSGGSDTFTGVTTVDGPTTVLESGTPTGLPTTFIAGGSGFGGYDFVGQSAGDTLDGSAFPSGATIDAGAGSATIDATESDAFSGMTCFVGSSAGNTAFVAPGSAEQSASCSENGVHVNFAGKGSGNVLYLGNISVPVAVNPITGTVVTTASPPQTMETFSGMQTFSSCLPSSSICPVSTLVTLDLSSWPTGTTVDTATETVSAPGVSPLTYSGVAGFIGSKLGGTTFEADSTDSLGFTGHGSGNTLDLTALPSQTFVEPACPVIVVSGGNPCSPPAGATLDTYSGIQRFVGSGAGTTSFVPDTAASYTFVGQGSQNTLDLSAAPSGIVLDLTVQCNGLDAVALVPGENPCSSSSSPVDAFSGVQNFVGSSQGGTTFTAPGTAGGLTFTGEGSGNGLAFGAVSGGGLVVNDTTSPGSVATSSGVSPSWSDTFSGVTAFTGPSSGSTVVDAPASGDIAFTGQGSYNTLDLGGAPAGTLVDEDPPSGPDVATLGNSSGIDTFTGVACVAGSSAGSTSFVAPPAAAAPATGCIDPGTPAVNFAGRGTGNSLNLTALTVATRLDPIAGTALTTTQPVATLDTFSSVTSFAVPPALSSTLDASGMPAGTTIDAVNGVVTPPTAAFPTITFSGFKGFVGSSLGGTTFEAPGMVGGDTFTGQGSSGDALSFAAVPAGGPGVTIDLEMQEASSGSFSGGPDTFSGMQTFTGSPDADVFLDGSQAATLVGGGGTDTLSFADATLPANVTLGQSGSPGTATGGFGGSLSIEGIQNVVSSPAGGTITGNLQPSTFTGGPGNDTFVAVGGNDTVNGGGGTNTLDLSQAPGFVTLNLGFAGPQVTQGDGVLAVAPGTIQVVLGSNNGNHLVAGNTAVKLVGGSSDNWLQGGPGNDTLIAGPGNDTLVGGSGYTSFVGGAGADTFYPGSGNGAITDASGTGVLNEEHSPVGVKVNLGTTRYTTPSGVTLEPGTAVGTGTVTLKRVGGVGIEQVIGSNYADILVGDSSSNVIEEPATNSAADLLVGLGGGDRLIGGSGRDTFITGSGDNIVIGGTSGHNTIDYAQAPSAVTVNLATHVASANGYGGSDQLTRIQDVIGSPNSGDSLTLGSKYGVATAGNGTNVTITGSKAGYDVMKGGSGGDTFVSIGPKDTMRGGAGPNEFFANNGYEDFIYGGGVYDTAVVDCIDVKYKTIHNVTRIIEPSGGCGSTAAAPRTTPTMGYIVATGTGGLYSLGSAGFYGSKAGTALPAPVTSIASRPDGKGYWLVTAKGNVYGFGEAASYGTRSAFPARVVGVVSTADGKGYWLVTAKGNVYGFGDARWYGSTAGRALPAPVVGMARTPDGGGYWLVTAKGNVYGFGDARWYGSAASRAPPAPVVGIAAAPKGGGYWLVTAKGNLYGFGDTRWYGSTAGRALVAPVVGMAATPDGGGYWLAGSEGTIYAFGDARSYGPSGRLPAPLVAIAGS